MHSLFKRCGFLSCWRPELYLGGDLGGAGRWQGVGVSEENVCTLGWPRPQAGSPGPCFLSTCLSLRSCGQAGRSVALVLITEASSCVWWARPSPRPRPLLPPRPGLAVCHLFSQSPLYWPVASCSQSDPNFPCEVFPRAHTRACTAPRLLSSTPSPEEGGKEEENSRE